ncbi:MAG TPA: hypothetical protein DCR44_05515 [Acholeplasmatales bacterium]|nr:hypothetical protein [Acholeplasmatales bacterium]
MSFSSFVLTAGIIETVETFVGPYITQGIDLLTGLAVWLQAAVLVGAAILILIGLFTFIKKTYKMILVLAIIGAIGYFLYTSGTLDGILGGLIPPATTTTAASMVHILRALPF